MRRRPSIRWSVVALTVVVGTALSLWCSAHLTVVSDVIELLPRRDPSIDDARRVLVRYAPHGIAAIDVGLEGDGGSRADLLAGAARVKDELAASGRFVAVGNDDMLGAVTALARHVETSLPTAFSAEDLERELAPSLAPAAIAATLARARDALAGMDGIGQAASLTRDPLGWGRLVLARLERFTSATKGHLEGTDLVSDDGRHVLLLAWPKGSPTDGPDALAIDQAVTHAAAVARREAEARGHPLRIVAAGAHRAALDNERSARADTSRALAFTTVLVALLLLLCSPRPLFSLLSMVPAVAGTILALFTITLLQGSISVLTLGFGGAVISFTVDHGILYVLSLARRVDTAGKDVAREVWAGGLVATLTTVGSYAALLLTDFPLYREIGLFAGLGVSYAFLFVHVVFPRMIPALPGAAGTVPLLLRSAAAAAYRASNWRWSLAIGVAFAVLAGLARPELRVDLDALNSVSPETLRDEREILARWGDVLGGGLVVVEATSRAELAEKVDRTTRFLADEERRGRVSAVASSSSLWPGASLSERNADAWRRFWSPERLGRFRDDFATAAGATGFSAEAFAPMWAALQAPVEPTVPPEAVDRLFGIKPGPDGTTWLAAVRFVPGAEYDARSLQRALAEGGYGSMLDPRWFSERLSEVVGDTFLVMLALVGLANVVMLVLFFMDAALVLLALAPVVFAFVATLGTMTLLGHPIDVAAILLAVVVLGMGIDYGLYFICAYQRHRDDGVSAIESLPTAVFLAAASTLAGFGVLAFADHAVLRSAGRVVSLGIAYCAIGAFALVPPALRWLYGDDAPGVAPCGSPEHRRRFLQRYRHAEVTPRMFARFKSRLDPMFPRLAALVSDGDRVLDVGTGFGIPLAWLASCRSGLRIRGVEPDAERARVAGLVLRREGEVSVGAAPALPAMDQPVDVVLFLDVAHYLDDRALDATLQGFRERLRPGGRLVLRATVPGGGPVPFHRRVETRRLARRRQPAFYRPQAALCGAIERAGFVATQVEASAPGREETWFLAQASEREG